MSSKVVQLQIAEARASKPLTRVRLRIAKVTPITLPDGTLIYAPGRGRPEMRNHLTTAEDFRNDLIELSKRIGPFVVLELAIGDAPITVIPPAPRPTPFVDTTPCDV